MPGAQRDQKKVLSPLETELQVVASHHVGLGTKHRPSAEAANALNCRFISLAPTCLFYVCTWGHVYHCVLAEEIG